MNRSVFHKAITHFHHHVENCNQESNWDIVTDKRTGYQYLIRKMLHPLPESWTPPSVMMDELEQEQDAAVAAFTKQVYITLEHHIVYSPTFQAPVLYFNAYDPDGSSLSLDQVYDWVISAVSGANVRLPTTLSPQGGITQDEHPILGLPFYYIHPCNTHSVMKQFEPHVNTMNYIKIWLSFFGPTVGCNLSSQLFLDMSNKAE
ncbi:hypothetical protein K492DRAFT_203197 [Lichtheimia hyalospora FSU 10163]|nr:hypothetical protein K492DRAFT_203197 [Lichtheimia hyalospora FSU 10163]